MNNTTSPSIHFKRRSIITKKETLTLFQSPISMEFMGDSLSNSSHSGIKSVNSPLALKSPLTSASVSKKPFYSYRKTQEESMRELFLGDDSTLLYAYCESLIKQDSNPRYIKVLLMYYASRGKLVELMQKLSEREIETSSIHNQLFRGNSIFTKVYNQYINLYCSQYLQSTTHKFLQYLNEMNIDFVLEDCLENKSSYEQLTTNVLQLFSTILLDTIDAIPSHLRLILRALYKNVTELRGQNKANCAFKTLFFLRYLLTPLLRSPEILKILQKAVTNSSCDLSNMSPEQLKFKFTINQILQVITRGPTIINSTTNMVNIKEMEKSLIEVIEIIKGEMKKISLYYKKDFADVFSVVKGKYDGSGGTSSIHSTAPDLINWMNEKERGLMKENDDLRKEIVRLEMRIEKLKQRVNGCAFEQLN
ncbi:Ras-GAP domain-containing protein [Entamoeba marina]